MFYWAEVGPVGPLLRSSSAQRFEGVENVREGGILASNHLLRRLAGSCAHVVAAGHVVAGRILTGTGIKVWLQRSSSSGAVRSPSIALRAGERGASFR